MCDAEKAVLGRKFTATCAYILNKRKISHRQSNTVLVEGRIREEIKQIEKETLKKNNEIKMLGFEEVKETDSPLAKRQREDSVNKVRCRMQPRIERLTKDCLWHCQCRSWCFNSSTHLRYTQR